MDLRSRSAAALDWPFVLDRLAEHARTATGRRQAVELGALGSADAVADVFDAVDEAIALREGDAGPLPLGGIEDVGPLVETAARGRSLELAELHDTARTVAGLVRLRTFVDEHAPPGGAIARRAEAIVVDAKLARTLERAFDTNGDLSEKTYPRLGELRRKIASLERRVRDTLEALLAGDTLSEHLHDRYVTVRSERLVVPLKAQSKNLDLGIVHDVSRSGQTVYVEPREAVPLNNDRRIAEGALTAERARIVAELSSAVGANAEPLAVALAAATDLDLIAARADFARRLGATRPAVGNGAAIELRAARHPVLVLDGVRVVANDLALTDERPVMVLSGPNAGGKTVALKTLGLAANLVRIGCFVPADEGSRVDYFDAVLADIGDQQTVHGGLSSFSGHLACLRAMEAETGHGTLLLLDELASGTDPTQGGALAQALIERFAAGGARIVATTHFAQVKAMGASDGRVTVAAMEYLDGAPTYRVVEGIAGESHALETALDVGFDRSVVDRARVLMDEGERALADALAGLEAERARSVELTRRLEESTARMAEREEAVATREARVRRRAAGLEKEIADAFGARVRDADREVARIIAELQRRPTLRRAAGARDALAVAREAALVEQRASEPQQEPPDADAGRPLAVGDRVRVAGMGATGDVLALRNGEVEVRTGSLTIRVPPTEVSFVAAAPKTAAPSRARTAHSKRVRTDDAPGAVRVPANTLDLRGERVGEALVKLERFLDEAVLGGHGAAFVLHGHGTGAMKQAVRDALARSPYVARSGPADEDQGGDAFTVAVLR